MKQYQKSFGSALIVVALVVASFFTGKTVGLSAARPVDSVSLANKETSKPVDVDFAPFWETWQILQEKFVPASTTDIATNQEKVWGSIQGLASSLGDPYTVFLPPVENEIFESDVRGNFEGVGMEVALRDGVLTVVSPLKGTPAYKAGIKSGDKIIKIDGKSTYNTSVDESVALIRGKKGTAVVFSIVREGVEEPLEISVLRDVIDIPTIDTQLRSDGVFVISLYNFSASSPELFRKALREFIDSRTDKLVLDLRGNPGGYLEAAISMASWFLPSGKIVVQEDFGTKQEKTIYRSSGYDIFNDKLKFVILIDGGSASASEILAGALREHNIAKLVGAKTFGKGSVQQLIPITPETSLKVTIAHWLTPEGRSISQSGIEPDVAVKITPEDVKAGRDPQKEKAVELLLNWKK